jgi:hypothetical protein
MDAVDKNLGNIDLYKNKGFRVIPVLFTVPAGKERE